MRYPLVVTDDYRTQTCFFIASTYYCNYVDCHFPSMYLYGPAKWEPSLWGIKGVYVRDEVPSGSHARVLTKHEIHR